MGLASALVDQARVAVFTAILEQLPDGSTRRVRVDGETQHEWAYGQYFDCRIDSPAAPEGNDPASGRVRAVQHPTMLYAVEDWDGNPVNLHADDRVTVESDDFGTTTFEVSGEPTLYRKKSGLVCGQAALTVVLDFGITDGRIAQHADAGTTTIHIASSGS